MRSQALILSDSRGRPRQAGRFRDGLRRESPAQTVVEPWSGLRRAMSSAIKWLIAGGPSPMWRARFASRNYADLMAGQVQVIFDGMPAAVGNIRAGKLKVLAITGTTRHPAFPDVPTFAEIGIADFEP